MKKLFRNIGSCRVLLLLLAAALLWFDPGCVNAQDSNATVRDFNSAAALQNSGFYDRAVGKWDDFVRKYPNDSRLDRVYYYLGICQLHTKKYPEAVQTFQKVTSQYPNFTSVDGAQYNMGMAYFQMATGSNKPEDFKAAADALGTVASKYGTSSYAAKALYFQGEALFSIGDVKGAADAYGKLVNDHKNSPLLPDAYYALGTAQQDLGQDAEAAKTLNAFLANATLANHELATEVRLRLGISLFNQKQYDEADKLFAAVAAVQDAEGADFALLRQGQCRLETEKTAEAAKVFDDLLKKFPNSPYAAPARLAIGKCYYLTEKFDDARKAFEPLVGADLDESAEASYWMGLSLIKLDKPQDALTLLDGAVKKHTDGQFATYLQMARIDAMYDLPDRRKETAKLYDDFAKQFADHPLTVQAAYMSALAALGEEDFDMARQHAEAFLAKGEYAGHELRPAVLWIAAESHLLAADADQGGDIAKAEQLYRELVLKHPEHARVPRAHLRTAWCLHQNKKYDDSLNYLKGVLGSLKDSAHVAEAQLLIGRNHHAVDRDRDAATAYDAALSAKGDWDRADEVLIAAAISLRAVDDLVAAADRLSRLVTGFPQSTYRAQATYQLGEILQEQQKYDDAIKRYQEVIATFAESPFVAPANYGLSAAYFAKEDYDNAILTLDKLLSGQDDAELAARGLYLRGLTRQRKKDYANAVTDLKAFLDTKPEGDEAIDARYALVLCQIESKQFGDATTSITALLDEKPDYTHADNVYYNLGHALMDQDKVDEAAGAFRTLAEKFADSPLAPEAWFHLGRSHETAAGKLDDESQKKAEVAKASDAYAKGLAKVTEKGLREKLQCKLGEMLFRQDKFVEAATTLTAQVNEHPDGELVGPGRFLAAESFFRQDKFTEALPLFVRVAEDKVAKYHDRALYQAGVCGANLDNWPESQKRYQELIDQFPQFDQIAETRYGLGLALYKQNKLPEAKAAFEKVTEETEAEAAAKARYMIGQIAFAEKKYEDAVEEFLTVASGYPYKDWQAKAQFEAGRCLVELKRSDNAKAVLQVVVDKFADHPLAADARKLIDSLN